MSVLVAVNSSDDGEELGLFLSTDEILDSILLVSVRVTQRDQVDEDGKELGILELAQHWVSSLE